MRNLLLLAALSFCASAANAQTTAQVNKGYPEYDITCTGDLAADTANVSAEIAAAELAGSTDSPGGPVVLNGAGQTCQLDGSQITIGRYRHNSPLIIQFKGKIVMNPDARKDADSRGFYVAPTNADAGSNVWFEGIRGGNALTSFGGGNGAAELDACTMVNTGCSGLSAIECAGCDGMKIENLTINGYELNGGEFTGSLGSPVFVHAFWGTNGNCGSPPCGSTQITIQNDAISALGTFTGGNGAVPLYIGNSVAKLGAWRGGTTYQLGWEVTSGGNLYTSIAANNINHAPPNATYWSAGRISGFDATLSNLTLISGANTPKDAIYIEDFGNINWIGKISWLLNGGIEIEDTGNATGSYNFNNINDEELPANVSMFTFTGQVGAQGPTTIANMNMSDNVNGGNYVFYARSGQTGCGNVGGPFYSNIVTDVAGSGLYKFFNPNGCQMRTNSTLPEIYSSLSNPLTPQPVAGFGVHAETRGQNNDLHRNNVPAIVRVPNIIDNYNTAAAQTYGSVTITTGIADPYGGTNAFQAVTTSAPSGIKFYDHNITPTAGDVYIGMVAMRANNSDGFNANPQAVLSFSSGVGITTNGYRDASQDCTPSTTGVRCDNLEWEWFYTILKVVTTDGMAHELIYQSNANATTGSYQYFAPILVKVPNGSGFSDSDIQDYARSLTSYPPSALVGQLSNTNGPVTQTIASGTATMGKATIAPGACAAVVTESAPGVESTDNIQVTFNADPTSRRGYEPSTKGTLSIVVFPTSGHVNFKVCNNTVFGITPDQVVLNWSVRRP